MALSSSRIGAPCLMGRKAETFGAFISIILLGITIAWYFQYQENAPHRRFSMQMLNEDCFPVDVTWIEEKKDYNRSPVIWDCSRDISGDLKPEYQGPIPDIRRVDS